MSFDERAFHNTFFDDKARLAEIKLRSKGSEYELSSVLYYPPALACFEAFSVKVCCCYWCECMWCECMCVERVFNVFERGKVEK